MVIPGGAIFNTQVAPYHDQDIIVEPSFGNLHDYDHFLVGQANAQLYIDTFGGTTSADLDSDGDGFSDLDECIAGTDPNNAASKFTTCIDLNGADLTLSWPTANGRIYDIESTSVLDGTIPWQTYQTNVSGGSFVVPQPVSGVRQFYRVSVRLQ